MEVDVTQQAVIHRVHPFIKCLNYLVVTANIPASLKLV